MSTTIADRLELDAAAETRRIAETLRFQVGETLRRGGIVVAMSGGVDSSVCAALAVEAVGPGHVLGLGLPERESDPQSLALARDWARHLAIEFVVEDVTATLEAKLPNCGSMGAAAMTSLLASTAITGSSLIRSTGRTKRSG